MRVRSNLLVVAAAFLAGSCAASEEYAGYAGHWVDVIATAYSPNDDVDSHYHDTKGERWRWITADGTTDVRQVPYGIAVPLIRGKPAMAFGTQIIIPVGQGYLDRSVADRVFTVDDVGNGHQYFKHRDGLLHIDLRYKNHASAIQFAPQGSRKIRVFVAERKLLDTSVDPYAELRTDLFWDPAFAK